MGRTAGATDVTSMPLTPAFCAPSRKGGNAGGCPPRGVCKAIYGILQKLTSHNIFVQCQASVSELHDPEPATLKRRASTARSRRFFQTIRFTSRQVGPPQFSPPFKFSRVYPRAVYPPAFPFAHRVPRVVGGVCVGVAVCLAVSAPLSGRSTARRASSTPAHTPPPPSRPERRGFYRSRDQVRLLPDLRIAEN